MIKKYWYQLYLFAIVLLSVLIIVTAVLPKNSSDDTTELTSAPIESLAFYTPNTPLTAQAFMHDWFGRNGITDTSASNLTIRSGSYDEKVYRLSDTLYRDITFYIDSKNPSVSYKVQVQVNLTTNINPLVYITCPDVQNQQGASENCRGMTQI